MLKLRPSSKPQNPFLTGGYHGKQWFCDREGELQQLITNIEHGRNTVLHAWRRIGKTQLVRHLFDELEQNGQAKTIFVDLEPTTNIAEAVKAIIQATHDRFGKTSSGLSNAFKQLMGTLKFTIGYNEYSGLPELSFGHGTSTLGAQSLSALGEFLSGEGEVVIALDEFQKITSYPEENAEATFRS